MLVGALSRGSHRDVTGDSQLCDASLPGMTNPPRLKVLIVDDEPSITELLSTALRYEGFEVESAASGSEALHAVEAGRPDVVLLDVQLPDLDGFAVQSRLTNVGVKVPIIFLTARHGTADKVRGLTMGADDYITKPFSVDELVARVRVALRRSGHRDAEPVALTFADLELHEDTHEVLRAGRAVDLTPTEFKLLRYLLANPRRVLSKHQILMQVWRYDFDGDVTVVETYIGYLRRKIDTLGVPLIHTVRGVGYSLRLPRE